MSLPLSPEVTRLLRHVADFLAGAEAYAVGGFVRDALLGRPIYDVDLALAGDVLTLGRGLADALQGHYVPLHREHAIVRIVLPAGGPAGCLDLAALRGSLKDDLAARDFTIDAMACPLAPLAAGLPTAIVDPYDGRRDLERRCVRVVGPDVFRHDGLRLLRAVRLGAELDFCLEAGTVELARRDVALLRRASPERQRDELARLMATPRAAWALHLMDDLGLLEILFPELIACRGVAQPKEHYWDVFDHSLATVAALDTLLALQEPQDARAALLWRALWQMLDEGARLWEHLRTEVVAGRPHLVALKMAALLHDIAKPETKALDRDGRTRFFGHSQAGAAKAAAIMRRLRFSRAEEELVRVMVEEHLRPGQLSSGGPPSRRALYRYFRDTGAAGPDLLLLNLADHLASRGPLLEMDRWLGHVAFVNYVLNYHYQRAETPAPPRLVNGHEIMAALGLGPGPLVGQLLELVSEAQAAGEVATKEEALALARRALGQQPVTVNGP